MGFKLPKTHKSLFYKMNGKASDSFKPKHPVVVKPLGEGIKAEANQDGTTYVSPDVDLNSYEGRLILEHEEAHHDQFEALWDKQLEKEVDEPNENTVALFAYDDKYTYWKGDAILRDKENEGNGNLEWEEDAENRVKAKIGYGTYGKVKA